MCIRDSLFTLHGLFLQRQAEVSDAFATICAARVVTAAHCWEHILYGKNRHRFAAIVQRNVARAMDEQVGLLRPLVPLLVGSDNFQSAKTMAGALLKAEQPSCLRATYTYTEEQMAMKELLASRMQRLPSSEFERVLHPAFEEDEWKLIAIGGLLGLVVGVFQLMVVFKDML